MRLRWGTWGWSLGGKRGVVARLDWQWRELAGQRQNNNSRRASARCAPRQLAASRTSCSRALWTKGAAEPPRVTCAG